MTDIQIPLIENNFRFNSFFRKAASLWKTLPVAAKSSISLSSFKLFTVDQNKIVGIFVAVITIAMCTSTVYAVDCAWVTGLESLNPNKRTYHVHMVPMKLKSI